MIKRAAVFALCIVISISLCSCYDYKELKNYTFVMGIGVDLEDGRYKVTAELGCISDGGNEVRQAQKSSVIERSAASFPLALSLLTDTTGGELYFKNCAVAVLGEELCENGIGDVVEYLVKSPDFQTGMTLATAVGKAENIFSVEPTADGITSIEKSTGGYNWTETASAEYAVYGNVILYSIPLSSLGLTADNCYIKFKVTDNITKPDDIMDYYVSGDSAPIGRLSYSYGY